MPSFKTLFLKLFCFSVCLIATLNTTAQICSGTWALQRPGLSQCVSGQWIGWENTSNPPGCPINPIYTGVQINTFTFTNPVSYFSIDFKGFDGPPNCPRIEIKLNGIFYPLTASNISDFPTGSTCTTGSFSYVALTADGYLTISNLGGTGLSAMGRITISNVNATSVSVSTNDGFGTTFSNPFNCITVPLKLESFTGASNNGCNVILNWQTGIEQNIKNIEIERSEDGILFHKTDEVGPKGSNSRYSFVTANAKDAFFRLKINDLDGYYEYSEIIYIKSSCNKPDYSLNPNPARDVIEVSGLTNNDWLLLSNMAGRIIRKLNFSQNNKFNIQSLVSGMYILQVINAGSIKATFKLIKQ